MILFAAPLQDAVVTAAAMLCAAIGVLATLRRGHWLPTLLFSSAFMAVAAMEASLLGVMRAESAATARTWATTLLGVSALASWLWLGLSVVLARPQPMQQLLQASAYLTLALAGCVTLFFVAGTRYVIREVSGLSGDAVLVLGGLGKVYLMYLVVVLVAILMNLEGTLRSAPASHQRRLRPLVTAFAAGALASLVAVSAGLVFGGLRVSWLSASAVAVFAAGCVTALTLARRRLSDMGVPAARPVIYYSSVSLTLAGVFLLGMAALSKVLPALTPGWKRAVMLGLPLAVAAGGLLLLLSPRTSRTIKRFIDRNFYANRYDYRREWERVSRALTPTARPEDLCRQIEALVRSVFDADRIAVHLRQPSGAFRCVYASPGVPPAAAPGAPDPVRDAVIVPENPLVGWFAREREPFVFRQAAADLDRLPVAAENRVLVEALGAAVCSPLVVGEELVGLLWLSDKRIDEDYTHEDVEFLGAMSRQIGAALRFAHLAVDLAETRQLESMHRLSGYVLHDIKNQVSGLSLMLENARRHLGDPEFQRDALRVVERTVGNLKELMAQVSAVSRPPALRPRRTPLAPVLEQAAAAAGLGAGAPARLDFRVDCPEDAVAVVDPDQLGRLLTNLLVNAREAIEGSGRIELEVRRLPAAPGAGGSLVLVVRDDGRGMTEEFQRGSLFRPFATTKPSGLGIGLAHSKGIVEAHGGTIVAESRPGRGTRFEVRLPQPPAEGAAEEATA